MSTGERVCWGLAILGAGMAAAPFVADEALRPMGDARFALMVVGAVLAPTCFICAFLFRSRNRGRMRLLAGKDLFVRWNYTEEEWRAFAGGETERQAGEKRTLLWITAAMMIVAIIVIAAVDRKASIFVGTILAATWILCLIAARVSLRGSRRNARSAPPEARISADGLLLGAEFHLWRGWGNRFERCALDPGPPLQVAMVYSAPSRYSRTEVEVRVPVPAGREAEAEKLLARLQTLKR